MVKIRVFKNMSLWSWEAIVRSVGRLLYIYQQCQAVHEEVRAVCTQKMKKLRTFETARNTFPNTQHNISEEFNAGKRRYEYQDLAM